MWFWTSRDICKGLAASFSTMMMMMMMMMMILVVGDGCLQHRHQTESMLKAEALQNC